MSLRAQGRGGRADGVGNRDPDHGRGAPVILVHRLRGEAVWLNPDLIESIEATPDTVVTLVDGRRAVVSDPVDEVVERILKFRASVLVTADDLRHEPPPALRVVPDQES